MAILKQSKSSSALEPSEEAGHDLQSGERAKNAPLLSSCYIGRADWR